MQTRYWRLSVKNSRTKSRSRSAVLAFGILALSAVFGCQKGSVEYVKYPSEKEVPRISVDEAKKEADAGTAIIVDSRAEAAYKQEHIANSISLPSSSLPDKFEELPKGKKIIVYCS